MPEEQLFLVAGLGNPGDRYAQTRHNIGFIIVDELSRQYSIPLNRSRFDADYGKGRILSSQVVLAKPQSFMNRSGFPVQKLSGYFKISIPDIIVIHDDLDLEFGRIMLVKGRGHGGHNGIRSLVDILGSRDFIRIRVGVGRPQGPVEVTGHVLGVFSPEETQILKSVVTESVKACATILKHGIVKAMNRHNTR